MNDQDKIAEQAAEIAALNKTIAWYQGQAGQRIGEAARAGIAGGPASVDEAGWLVEIHGAPSPLWLTANAEPVKDAREALRFSRRRDAEGFLKVFLNAKFGDDAVGVYKRRLSKESYSVTEHIWSAATASAPQPDVPFAWAYRTIGTGEWRATMDKRWATCIDGMESKPLFDVAQPAAQLAVPQGYKMVPIEPTDAMCIATREKFSIGAHYAAHIYKTMLAAAPAAPLPAQPEQIQPQQPGSIRPSAEPAGQHDAKTSIFDEPKEGHAVKVRIKRGAVIGQDMRCMKWPTCLAPRGQKVDPEMVFDAVWNGRHWDCRAHGYGKHGQPDSYGNGSIFVSNADDVHIIEPSAEDQVPAGTAGCSQANLAVAAPLPDQTGPSIRYHADFVEDVLRLSQTGVDRKTLKAIRKDIYDTIDARVANFAARALAASPSPAPAQPTDTSAMEDPILVPRGLIGAACYVLRKNKPDCEVLKKLRALTFAPNSVGAAPAQQQEPYTVRVMNALRMLHVGDSTFEGWYSNYYGENGEGGQCDKQRCRDAYAAGMEDPAIASVLAAAQCRTCNGHGLIGSMTAEGGEGWPCPDCESVETAAPGASIGDVQ